MDYYWWKFKTSASGLLPSIVLDVAFNVVVLIAAAVFGGLPWLLVALIVPMYSIGSISTEYFRRRHNAPRKGRLVLKQRYAQKEADKLRRRMGFNKEGILWGNVRTLSEDSVKGYAVVGDVGSGKSLTIRMTLRQVLKGFRRGSDRRALIYDSKLEYTQYVFGMDLQVPVVILNPFDVRHAAWAIAVDIDNPIVAKDLAALLFPINPRATQRFFEEAVQALAASILRVFIRKASGRWTFRQFYLVMRDDKLIAKIAAADESADATVQRFLQMSGEGRGNVMATVTAKLAPYEEIAACWEHAVRTISLKEWMMPGSSSVFILGNYEIARKSVDLINRIYMSMIVKFALNLPDDQLRRTWMVVDEATEAGEFDLMSAALRGRSKGLCTVLGIQEIGALYEVYGENRGRSLIAQCASKAFLKMSSKETAEWASGVINDYTPAWEDVLSKEGEKSRSAFPPEYFMNQPPAGRIHGLHGVYLSPSLGCYPARYTPSELNELLGENEASLRNQNGARTASAFQLVPAAWQELRPWNETDSRQFGITHDASDVKSDDENGDPDDLDDINRFEF